LLAGTPTTALLHKTNIAKAFADIAAKATPADVLVVYFSGHGLAYGDAEKAQFYYLTKDIAATTSVTLKYAEISPSRLRS
jgi:uncharacterized caspase-like protein